MKKNLFLLFSIYFFVLQPLIIWLLRWQTNFFRLGAINLVAILLIGLLNNSKEGEKREEIKEHEKPVINKEAKISFQDHFRAVAKERRKKSELIFPSFISLMITVIFFFLFQFNGVAMQVILLFAIVLGFVVFIILTLISKHRITKRFRTLAWTKIYLILLVCSLALTAYDYYQVHQDFGASLQDYVAQNIFGQERIPTNGYVFTGQWTILGTGLWATTGIEENSSDIMSGTDATGTIQQETGTVLWASTDIPSDNQPTDTTTPSTTAGNQKLMDAVIYLIKKYNIPLVTKTDIHFTYVTSKNPYYSEWRTAYANKLIWISTNPSKYIICQSYIVMKWILEKWEVTYTPTTVLTNYRVEAAKKNELNGCIKGRIVTDKTL